MTSKPSWLGYTLNGRYQIQDQLGQGGMSAVYRATDPNLRRPVAIKLIHSHLAGDPEFVRRFEEEAAAVARLRHPNIIQVFDFNHDGDTYYMVLEFLPGQTLLEKLEQANQQRQLLSLSETMAIMIPLCDAVAYAHRQGMIHRDLKPANVMINPQGDPVLMDFGIAKIVGGESMTATGGVIGTVAYLSPEQIRGQKPDHRADIYALGIILYQMITGRLPFQGENTAATMMQHLTAPIPDVRQFNRNTPPALVAVIQKALAKEADHRYQSAEELGVALRQLQLEGMDTIPRSVPAAIPQPATQAGTTGMTGREATGTGTRPQTGPISASYPTPTAAPPPAIPRRRPAWFVPVAGLAAMLILTVCIAAALVAGQQLFGNDEATPSPTPTTFFVASAATDEATTPVQTPIADAVGEAEEETTVSSSSQITATPSATATVTPSPEPPTIAASPTLLATDTPQPTATSLPSPTATATPEGLRAEITTITIVDGRYSVEFRTFGYFSDTSSTHVHFFWNTIAPDQAGVPANPGNWKLYGSPSPFTGYTVSERPGGATQMCILVANPDHSVQLGTGNCFNLP